MSCASGIGQDTDTLHFAHCVVLFENASDGFVQFVDIIVDVGVFSCFDRAACDHITASVNQAECGVSATHVDTNYIRFCHVVVII